MPNSHLSAHDRYVRSCFAHPALAKEFLSRYLDEPILEGMDLSSLALTKESYIKDTLRQKVTDLLYTVNYQGKPGYLYILIEHASTPHPLLPFRVLGYMSSIMEDHIKHTKTRTLPIIYPLIFYTGKYQYRYSTDLFDLFGDKKNLAKSLYQKPFSLIDLHNISESELEKFECFHGVGLALKYIRSSDLLKKIGKILKVLKGTLDAGKGDYIGATLSYLCEAAQIDDQAAFAKIIRDSLTETEMEDHVQTLAEYWQKEGMEKGRKEGALENAYAIARNLLGMGLGVDGVAKGTGLSIEQIRTLKRNSTQDGRQSA